MEEYKEILKKNSLTGKDMAKMLGMSYGSYRAAMSKGAKKGAPRWVKAFVMGFTLGCASQGSDSDET